MNSFLLTLTALLILVLGALFAAPLVVDWNDCRPVFEEQATKLLGRQVKVGGQVHMVLLPAPELRFDDVKVANEQGSLDEPLLEARSLEALLNIGALMTGAIEARQLTITDPILRLKLKADGTGNWSDVGRPVEALPFVSKDVTLDQVNVTGGRIELTKGAEPALVVEGVNGEASAASLTGPYKVSTTYTYDGRSQELRFSTSARDASGRFRLKSALRDLDRHIVYLLDGDVTGLGEKPAYEGGIIVRVAGATPTAPPAATAPQATSEAPAADPGTAAQVLAAEETPKAEDSGSTFELKGTVAATPDHAELPSFDITIHAKGRPQMLKGKLALDFGATPKAEAELAARWVDVDALLAAAGQQQDASPSAALRALADRLLAEAATIGEGTLAVAIDQASLGGDLVGNLDLALAAKDGRVTIGRLKAELPGENHLEASGDLAASNAGPVFTGPIKLEGSKLRTLTRWAAGDREMSAQASIGKFALAADATIGGGDLALDQATGELSDTKFSGALRYHGGEKRVIDLNLDSDRLDLREVLGGDVAWSSFLPTSAKPETGAGASPNLLAALRDDSVHVVLRVGQLMLPDIPAGKLDAKFALAGDTLDIEALDFAAVGAIALNGKGRIEHLGEAPAGKVDFALQAQTPESLRVVSELLGLSPSMARSKNLASLAPLDIHVGLTASREGNATRAALELAGRAASSDVALTAHGAGEPSKLAQSEIDIDASVTGDHPQAVLGLLVPDLPQDRLTPAGGEQGKLTLKAHGVPATGVTGRAELATPSMTLAFDGQGALRDDGVTLSGKAQATSRNAGLALSLVGLQAPPSATSVPLNLHADVTKAAQIVELKGIAGEIGGQAVQGSARFDGSGDKTKFAITASADWVSLPALLGSLIAWERTPATEELLGAIGQSSSEVWPLRGFALGSLGKAEGEITLSAKTLALGAPLQVADASLAARLDKNGLAITDLKGRLFGGTLTASGSLSPRGAGAALNLRAELALGKLEELSKSVVGPVLAKGPFTLNFDVSGEGLSPPGLVAGLSGEGTLALAPGSLQSLNAEPLKRMASEAAKSKKIKADKDQIAALARSLRDRLTHGTYKYAAATLPFEVKNGTLRVQPTTLTGPGAEITINGYLELASLRLDSEWVMKLPGGDDTMPSISLVLAGPLSNAGAIAAVIDAEAIESYLTMRRMQEDVERLETLDVSGRNGPAVDAKPPADQPADAKRSEAEPEPAPPTAAPPPAPPPPQQKPKPRAADLEQDKGDQSAPLAPPAADRQEPSVPAPSQAKDPQAEPPAAAASGSQDQTTPAASTGAETVAPAVGKPPAHPRRAPSAPDDWKKGVGILGGG